MFRAKGMWRRGRGTFASGFWKSTPACDWDRTVKVQGRHERPSLTGLFPASVNAPLAVPEAIRTASAATVLADRRAIIIQRVVRSTGIGRRTVIVVIVVVCRADVHTKGLSRSRGARKLPRRASQR